MHRWILPLLFVLGLVPGVASAQSVTFQIGPPAIRWEARPPMVVVAPGVWVVEDSPDEVFFYNGWYWNQHDGHWFRSRDHSGRWVEIERRRVPSRFYANPPGHYRHYRKEAHKEVRQERREDRRDRKHERRDDRRDRKDDRRGKGGKGGRGHDRH